MRSFGYVGHVDHRIKSTLARVSVQSLCAINTTEYEYTKYSVCFVFNVFNIIVSIIPNSLS